MLANSPLLHFSLSVLATVTVVVAVAALAVVVVVVVVGGKVVDVGGGNPDDHGPFPLLHHLQVSRAVKLN